MRPPIDQSISSIHKAKDVVNCDPELNREGAIPLLDIAKPDVMEFQHCPLAIDAD